MVILPTAYSVDVISGEGFTSGVNEGYYTHYSFYNYCPLCDHYGCLERGLKRNDEISCYKCGADYSFSGKDKTYKPRAWLTVYEPIPEPEPLTPAVIQEPLTPLQIAHTVFKSNKIL